MDARKKGDIYWRKLKRYLAAQKYKEEDFGTGDSRFILAKEVHSLSASLDRDEVLKDKRMLTGEEFKVMPPTSTGEELYKRNLVFAIKKYEYFSELLENTDRSDLIFKPLNNLVKSLKNAINTFYEAAGVDQNDGSKLNKIDLADAEEKHKKATEEFDRTVKVFKRNLALIMIENLVKGAKIEPDASEEYDDGFNAIYEKYGCESEEEKSRAERIRAEFNTLKRKEISLVDTLPKIKKAVRKTAASDSGNLFLTYNEAFEEYCAYLAEELRALSFAQRSCHECVKCILSGEVADPLIANYLWNHFGEKVSSIPLETPIYSIPGYVRVSLLDGGDDEYEFRDTEAMLRASEKLMEYRKTHQDKFEFQTITALLFGNEELTGLERMARSLRNAVREAMGEDFPAALSQPENYQLKQIWVSADAFSKISSAILLYAQSNEIRTIRNVLGTYETDVYYLSYSRQEKISLSAVEKLVEEGVTDAF